MITIHDFYILKIIYRHHNGECMKMCFSHQKTECFFFSCGSTPPIVSSSSLRESPGDDGRDSKYRHAIQSHLDIWCAKQRN